MKELTDFIEELLDMIEGEDGVVGRSCRQEYEMIKIKLNL